MPRRAVYAEPLSPEEQETLKELIAKLPGWRGSAYLEVCRVTIAKAKRGLPLASTSRALVRMKLEKWRQEQRAA